MAVASDLLARPSVGLWRQQAGPGFQGGHRGGLSALEVRGESAKWLLCFPFHLMEGLDHSPDQLVTEAAPGRV